MDIGSLVVGMLVGACLGYIGGAMRKEALLDQLRYENDRLMRMLPRRNRDGKFVRTRD